MSLETVQEIARAIRSLEPRQVEELLVWLESQYPSAIDADISSDIASGRLDNAIMRALDDEHNHRLHSL